MRFRKLGSSGLTVSEVGFGAWAIGGPARLGQTEIGWGKVDDATSLGAIRRALELGVNFIDTADVYGGGHSDELIGQALKGRRREAVIATKYGNRIDDRGQWLKDFSGAWARRSLEGSLRRLQTDYVDVLLMHSPWPNQNLTVLEDGAAEMERLKADGKIRCWGISIHPISHGLEAIRRHWGSALEVVFNVLERDAARELFPAAKAGGCGIIARVPLASGLLTGKFKRGQTFPADDHRSRNWPPEKFDALIDAVERLRPIAAARQITMAQLALLYILAYDTVSVVIPGGKTATQVEDNAAAAGLAPLTPAEVSAIEAAVAK